MRIRRVQNVRDRGRLITLQAEQFQSREQNPLARGVITDLIAHSSEITRT